MLELEHPITNMLVGRHAKAAADRSTLLLSIGSEKTDYRSKFSYGKICRENMPGKYVKKRAFAV